MKMGVPESVEQRIDAWKDLPTMAIAADDHRRQVVKDKLREHMLETYRLLRRGMGWAALAFPWVLVVIGLVMGVKWQPSISDYYYAVTIPLPASWEPGAAQRIAEAYARGWQDLSFPLRSFFCGGLIGIGLFLILYKGISWLENVFLNLAGLAAIGVALFPMNNVYFSTKLPTSLHFPSAFLLFLCMWFVTRFCAKDTLIFLDDPAKEATYLKRYHWLSLAMLGVLALGLGYFLCLKVFGSEAVERAIPTAIFWIEALGVTVFGTYWVIKSKEIAQHKFESPEK